MTGRSVPLGWGAWLVVALFTGSGLLHLVRPATFTAQVPDVLPAQTTIIVLSGVAELALAAGMVWRRGRRQAGRAAAVLLVLIFPGNLWQTWEAWQDWRAADAGTAYLVGTLVRLPLQLPLIWWAWHAGWSPVEARPVTPCGSTGHLFERPVKQ